MDALGTAVNWGDFSGRGGGGGVYV